MSFNPFLPSEGMAGELREDFGHLKTGRGVVYLARCYDGRAAIEPLIAELKNAFGIGKASTNDFDANEAAFLIKRLACELDPSSVRARPRAIASRERTPDRAHGAVNRDEKTLQKAKQDGARGLGTARREGPAVRARRYGARA